MNIKVLSISALALAIAAGAQAEPSFKRGLAEGGFSTTDELDQLTPGVSWYYNWSQKPTQGTSGQVAAYQDIEFLPMAWNANWSEESVRATVQEHPSTKYMLGFNEPNFTDQAHMTPAEAAAEWPRVQAICRELGLAVVSPAVNNSAWAEWSDPVKWMREFINLVGIDAVDYIAFHAYGGMGNITDTATRLWEEFHKPLWLTEFCQWPGGAGSVYVAPETQLNAMVNMVRWCEKTDYIYRYSWFQAFEKSHSNASSHRCPNYFLFDRTTYKDENNKTKVRWDLNERGLVYTYMSDYNPDVWMQADGTLYNAVDAIDHANISMGKSACAEISKPIEITNLINTSTVKYQFDVPETGDYHLGLLVSGIGEPTRFDPAMSLHTVNADGSLGTELCPSTTFTLPNDNEVYKMIYLPCRLNAGRQTLCIKGEGNPSGIRIAGVKLDDATGIDGVVADSDTRPEAPVNVYTVTGQLVRANVAADSATDGLPAGIYVAGNKKVVVK